MAQGFQSSFIPKGVGGEESVGVKKKNTSVAGVLALSIFVITVLASAGLFVYKSTLKSNIENLRTQLADAGKTIDRDKIGEMASFSRKLALIQSIVDKHQVASGFMSSLSSSTLKAVTFSDFQYDTQSGDLKVRMQGSADRYATVALQEELFSKNQYWNSVSFSDLRLGDEGGVTFKVEVIVDPEIVVYSPFIPEQVEVVDQAVLQAVDDLENLGDLDDIESSINDLNI